MNLKKLSVLWCCCFAPFCFSKSGYMVACIDDYPPYQYLDSPPHGIHVTALSNLAKVFNKKIQFIESPNFARCVQLLKTGEIDVIAGLNKNSDREKFAFYAPYRIEEDHVVISKKTSDISDYQSIKDKIIGVPRGTTYFKKFNDDTALNKVPIQSIRIGIELIIRNRIDVIITSKSVANLLIDDITSANLKATLIKQNNNKEEVSYFGFSKLNKLNLLPPEIINRTTQAFKQGKFKDDVNAINSNIKDK
ncbi:substrate-binding periplasmic protein [Colwelliaceae bacterium 6471]